MVGVWRLSQTPFRSFQYSLCRVVLMVTADIRLKIAFITLSVLALSSRFDGPAIDLPPPIPPNFFQYSLCRVVLMVGWI